MLDLVPLAGSGRVVTNRDRPAGFVAQRLEVQLPGAWPVSVAASAIGTDRQPSGSAVIAPAIQPPPAPNALGRELRRFLRHSYVHGRPVPGDLVRECQEISVSTSG